MTRRGILDFLNQLVRDLLVEDLAHRERDDHAMFLSEEAVDLAQGVARCSRSPRRSPCRVWRGAWRPRRRRCPAGRPCPSASPGSDTSASMKCQFVGPGRAPLVERGDGEDAAVDAHVADLRFVGDAAQGDDGPVLELEGRELPQLAPRSTAGRGRRSRARSSRASSSSGSPQTSRSRLAMTRQAVGEMSMPIHWRLRFCAATSAVPQPQKASSTMSFRCCWP